MARIPLQVAQRGIDAENVIQYPQGGGPVGAAVADLGQSISGVGRDFHELQIREQAKKDQRDTFDGSITEDEFRQVETAAQQEALVNAPADGSGMTNELYGEIDPATGMVAKQGSFDKRFDTYLERMPEGKVRDEFARKREFYRQQGFNRISPLEIQRRRDFEKVQIGKTQIDLVNDIMQSDPNDKEAFKAYVKRGSDLIRMGQGDALDKDVAVLEWEQNAAIARGEAIAKNDPGKLHALLGFRDPNALPEDQLGNAGSVKLEFSTGYQAKARAYGSVAGEAGLNQQLVGPVKQAFANLGIGNVKITSGHRTRTHNKAAGGAEGSQHVEHNAMDIDVSGYTLEERRAIVRELSAAGITGIGIGKNSIHADMGKRRAWGYRTSAGGADVPNAYADIIAEHRAGTLTRGGGDPVLQVVDRIIGSESGGDAGAQNPRSSASGLGQFTDGTWLATISKHRPDLRKQYSDRELIAMKTDRTLGREMTIALTKDNKAFLESKGIPATAGNILVAHVTGPGGAEAIFAASDDTPLANVLTPAAMAANPQFQGMTVGGIKEWANQRMAGASTGRIRGGGGAQIDDTFAALTLQQRLALANKADAALADQMADLRTQLETITEAAPIAIQNTGTFAGQLPDEQKFIEAYGGLEGPPRFEQFMMATQVAGEVYGMRTMHEDEISSLVSEARPTSTGLDATLEAERYKVLSTAASQITEQRNADPNAYVRQAFPSVERAYQSGNIEMAMATSMEAQKLIGIENVKPLTVDQAKRAADGFNKEDAHPDTRINSVMNLLKLTDDPGQRRAMFEQMVEAGLPDMAQGAFLAYERNDMAAANRLFQAAMTDVGNLPGKPKYSSEDINGRVQDLVLQDGGVGDVYYGIGSGLASAEERLRQERDSKLMFNSISLRVRAGQTLDEATLGAARDIMGDLRVVHGNRRAPAEILVPVGTDPAPLLFALEREKPKAMAALAANTKVGDDVPVADGTRAVFSASGEYYARQIGIEGFWRHGPTDGSFVFIDPHTGPVSTPDGKPVIFTPTVMTKEEFAASRPAPMGPRAWEDDSTAPATAFPGSDTGPAPAPAGWDTGPAPAPAGWDTGPAPGPSGAATPQPGDTEAPALEPQSSLANMPRPSGY